MLVGDIRQLSTASVILGNPEGRLSFSQFGEDHVLWAIFETHKRLDTGFYIDVGAFHPFRFSNTALLHLCRGWRGVNIDADPDAIAQFNKDRPDDVNIEAAVSDIESDIEFVRFNRGAVNSLDPSMVARQLAIPNSPFEVKDRMTVRTQRLDSVLNRIRNLPKKIDLLTIDCEGFDYRVLVSNDWNRYRPFAILVESHGLNLRDPMTHPNHAFLSQKGYRLVSHVFVTSIYLDR